VSLRIIAGSLGGRFIESPRGRGTRPTSERVREAWLSAAGPQLDGASVVDLFAGSGALGIEALSRGACHAHFVESNRAAVATLEANLLSLGLLGSATVVPRDVFRWLAKQPGRWDVALADPPYSGGLAERLVSVFREDPFAEYLWVEHAAEGGDLGEPSWSRAYGDSRISRFCSSSMRSGHDDAKGSGSG